MRSGKGASFEPPDWRPRGDRQALAFFFSRTRLAVKGGKGGGRLCMPTRASAGVDHRGGHAPRVTCLLLELLQHHLAERTAGNCDRLQG
jgi:hypothetical protein